MKADGKWPLHWRGRVILAAVLVTWAPLVWWILS